MNTTNRKSPMQSRFQNNNLWRGSFALPCIRPAAVPSLPVGLHPYHRLSPDSC